MQNPRLYFSAIIKLLILLGLLLLTIVFFNSLFTEDNSYKVSENEKIPISSIDISDMFKGQILKTRWNNKEVAVLLRQFPEKIKSNDTNLEDLHASLNINLRSQTEDYFVYINLGDSNNCPLFYSAGEFKDVCSANLFDEAGRPLKGNSSSFKVNIPPHYFNAENLIIGKWNTD